MTRSSRASGENTPAAHNAGYEVTAIKLHDLGYTVYGAARRTDRLAKLAERGIRPLTMDVTTPHPPTNCPPPAR